MFCSRCGVSLAEGTQFCVDCGHTVEGSVPAASSPPTLLTCHKCNRVISPGAHFCSHCGIAAPSPTIISSGGAAAAAATAFETAPARRLSWSPGKVAGWLIALTLAGTIAWLLATNDVLASQLKSFVTTAHAETITDGSIAIKPHGFASYKVMVPEGAIDGGVSGKFEASSRADNDVQVLLLTESEFAVWQSGYATSPFYDSGKVSKADMQAVLPSRAGDYYLVLSNRPSRVEKTVHVAAGLRYDTWMPDSVVTLKQKIWEWFE